MKAKNTKQQGLSVPKETIASIKVRTGVKAGDNSHGWSQGNGVACY